MFEISERKAVIAVVDSSCVHMELKCRIFGIDVNPSKFEVAKQFGVTDCINPKDYDKPIQQVLVEMTKW